MQNHAMAEAGCTTRGGGKKISAVRFTTGQTIWIELVAPKIMSGLGIDAIGEEGGIAQ